MLTQTVTITQNSTPNIIIGRRNTYETQQVIFDVSWLVQTYGEGTAELLIKRPKDASAYPVVAVLDGNTLTWTVSDTDTQDKGHGECEIYWYVNGGLAKSCICGITILRDIGDTTETAPDPYETWVDELARLGSETLANAQAAEQSANNAAQSATEAGNSAEAALESEENALNSENAAKASEQAAAASKQGAEQSATEAAQSANAAESSAANAQESADNSSASADRAEQAAASIEGDTERAEAAARTAQGAATSAQGSASTASTKATEASQSAATAGQAASTATQKAADASASATAAVDSASSAYASATAAGNAQTAAETAQGKAEDAQEAAETAAQSIEESATQIDTNTADILNLKSALNTKAGILKDTVSGSVASFVPDSTVPNLLGLDVHLEPIQDLHGYDSPWPAGGGLNLLYQAQPKSQTINGVEWSINEDGSISANGTATSASTFVYIAAPDGIGSVLDGDYKYINFPLVPATMMNVGVKIGNVWTSLYSNIATNITGADGKIQEMWFQIRAGQTANNITIYPMIYPADAQTPTAWTPYSNLCPISGRESVEVNANGTTHTIPLGQTVYGGTLDVTNGTLTVDRAMVDMGTLGWNYQTSGSGLAPYFFANVVSLGIKYEGNFSTVMYNLICSEYRTTNRSISVFTDGAVCAYGEVGNQRVTQIQIKDSRYTDADSFKSAMSGVQLCYELATPTPISTTPTEISTVEGQNNVFSPDGDVTVEYAADLKTYIDSKIAAAVAAMS